MNVRSATPEDAPAIARVHVASWQAGYRGILPDEVLDDLSVAERSERWHGYLTDPDNDIRTLVACDGDEVVGFVSLVAESRDDDVGQGTAEIAALYVDPERWRRGTGRALMDAALEALRRTGATEAALWVLEGNDRGRAFYAAYGLTPDGARQASDVGAPEIRLRCALRTAAATVSGGESTDSSRR
jgi:GNAT superfamily N-acetyltransferase